MPSKKCKSWLAKKRERTNTKRYEKWKLKVIYKSVKRIKRSFKQIRLIKVMKNWSVDQDQEYNKEFKQM